MDSADDVTTRIEFRVIVRVLFGYLQFDFSSSSAGLEFTRFASGPQSHSHVFKQLQNSNRLTATSFTANDARDSAQVVCTRTLQRKRRAQNDPSLPKC